MFQGTRGGQSDAIRAATASPYTHCGIVLQIDGRLMVVEAVQPVRITSLADFEKRSLPGTFHVRRPATAPKAAALAKARAWAVRQVGRDYDVRFQWGDDQLYCSELVWKAYQQASVRLCEPRRFHDYKLDHPAVAPIIASRYGSADRLPREEPVVAPSDLAASPLLVEVPRAVAKSKR